MPCPCGKTAEDAVDRIEVERYFSLTKTAKANELDPFKYLVYIFAKLSQAASSAGVLKKLY